MTKKNRGFTLYELIIVLAIIALLSVLVLANYRSGEAEYKLSQATQKFMLDLRQAQGMAMSGAEIQNPSAPPGTPYTARAFGIDIIDRDHYQLFLTETSASCQDMETISPKRTIRTEELPSGIRLAAADTLTEIFFFPPYPITCINNNGSERANYTFNFSQERGSSTSRVYVNNTGKIEMQ